MYVCMLHVHGACTLEEFQGQPMVSMDTGYP